MKEKQPLGKKQIVFRVGGSLVLTVGTIGLEAITHAKIAEALNSEFNNHVLKTDDFPKSEYTLVDLRTGLPLNNRSITGNAPVEQTVLPDEDPIKNVKINEEIPYTWFHPMSDKNDIWSYGVILRDPALYGSQKSLSDKGNVGEIFLNGPSDVGLDIQTNTQYLNDYKGSGERAALWLTAGPKDVLILMDETADKIPTPVKAVTADDKGFAGVLLPNKNVQLGIRVVRSNGSDSIKIAFGNISKADYADPDKRNHPSVIDTDKYLPESSVILTPATPVLTEQPVVTSPVVEPPRKTSQEALPEFLTESPVFKFQEAPSNKFFLAQSSNGEGWSHFVEFKLPDRKPGVFYRDRGSVGEIFVQTRELGGNSTNSFDLYMRTNPLFVEDYRQGQENRPGMWFKTQPKALIQLLDANNQVMTFNFNGKDYPVQSEVDGAGFGGLVLPDYQTIVKVRVVLPHPEVDTDTQIQFGAERPKDRGKSSTLDSTAWLPRP